MTQMVLIKEWLAYHVWMSSPVCPKVRLVTALLLKGSTLELLNNSKATVSAFKWAVIFHLKSE